MIINVLNNSFNSEHFVPSGFNDSAIFNDFSFSTTIRTNFTCLTRLLLKKHKGCLFCSDDEVEFGEVKVVSIFYNSCIERWDRMKCCCSGSQDVAWTLLVQI